MTWPFPPKPLYRSRLHRLASMACAVIGAAAMMLGPSTASAAPKLWKVSGGAATVYLYGSVHILKPATYWDTPQVETALGESRTLWLEIADIDKPADMFPLIQSLGLDAAHPLSGKLAPDDQVRLAAALKTLGAPPMALDKMRPWMAAITLSMAPLQKAGYDPASGVDLLLKKAASARGIPVMGFETGAQQLHYFADLSAADELDFLHQTLAQFADALPLLDKTEAAWEAGDERELYRLSRMDISESLYQLILVKRNQAFAKTIASWMATPGTEMVVVGAAHLAGPDSVQSQLRKMGYQVTAQ